MAVHYLPEMHPLRIARLQKGWSLATLSERAGLDASTICKIELGKMRVHVHQLYKLGQALGCEWWTLVSDENLHYSIATPQARN